MGISEDKYNALRKRLDQLGYRQTLDLTTVPLVEKLFADLLHTTESLKNVKQQTAYIKEESQAIIQQGDPYKAENTRLLRENNDLHVQIIKIKEETEGKVKELKNALRKSEHECADLQFLNSQYAHKLKALQKQDQAKSDRIQQLHERNMNAVVETPGGRRRHIAPRRPVLEIESPLPGSPTSHTPPQKEQIDPYMCDLLRVADKQIEELNRQVKSMEDANSAAQRKVETLAKQVSLRDKEIDRLQHLLEGGRPTKAMINDGMAESTDRVISHLNIQVEYLQQTNRELDAKLRASLSKQREEMEINKGYQTKNDDLQKRLEETKEELDRLKMEKTARLGTYETELDLIFAKIRDKENECNQEKAQHIALQEKVNELKTEKREMMKLLTASQVETEKFTLVVKRLEEDKKEITRHKQDLQEENKQLQRNVTSLEHLTNVKTTNMEHQKNMAEVNLQDRIDQLNQENRSNKNQITILIKELDDVQRDMNIKSEELIYYKQECSNLQSLIAKYAIPARDEPMSTIEKISIDRDKARQEISNLQSEMLQLRSNIKILTSERDNIDALYLQVTDELKRLRSEKTEQIVSESGDSLRLERDNAIAKLKKALSEKEGLAEQININKETTNHEIDQLKDNMREKERKTHSLTVERDLLKKKADSLKETVNKLEEQVAASSSSLYTAKAGHSHSESQIAHLKTLAGAAQRSRDDLHNKLSEINMELELAKQRNHFLEKQVTDLQDSLRGKNTHTNKMKQTLVDKEKDQDNLLQQLDDKTEKIHEMQQKFIQQENELQVLTMEIKNLEDKFKEQKATSSQKESEALSLRKQVNRLVDEVSQLESVKDVTLKHNKQLSDDIANMTSENQRLHEELKNVNKELELMRRDVNDKAHDLHNIEHVIGLKDADYQDIVSKYQDLTAECDRIARQAKMSKGDCHSLQRDLAATSDVKNALELRLKEQAIEIQNILAHNENLQSRINEMELEINEQKMMLINSGEEKRQILIDLDTVREINSKIEGQREAQARKAANRSVEVEQLQRVIENLTSDSNSLKRQVAAEKDCVRNLEMIINRGRQQEYENQSNYEDNSVKINHLEAQLKIRETELKEAEMKYTNLGNEVDNLKMQNNKLLREITNERFEREKAKNESNILKHKLESTKTPEPPTPTPAVRSPSIRHSRPNSVARPPTRHSRPVPEFKLDQLTRAEPVVYEPTLSPSSIKRHGKQTRRHVSSNDETDDSIMREINRTLKMKTPSTVLTASNNVSIMTSSLTETSISTLHDLDSSRPAESSIDSIALRIKRRDEEEEPSTGHVSDDHVISAKQLSRDSSLDKEVSDINSDVTFDGDEDDSVYQAIRSSQGRSSRQEK